MVEFNSGGNLSEQKGGKLSERYRIQLQSALILLCKFINFYLSIVSAI